MPRNDDDIQQAVAAMTRLTAASQALYMAHITAVKAGQSLSPVQTAALHDAVMESARDLVDVCDVPQVSESEIVAALLSE